MESRHDQYLDSPSKNSYIGSYYQPPDRIMPVHRRLELTAEPSIRMDPQSSPGMSNGKAVDSQAVVAALKTLQEKIRRLEQERKQAERSYQEFFSEKNQQDLNLNSVHSYTADSLPDTDNPGKKEVESKLQSAEARCKVLEKQLEYMRKMVENAKKEKNVVMESQVALQNQRPSTSNGQSKQEKLENLESICVKLSRTQALAEKKMSILEQKLLKEEHERKLVQEKAEELQRELNINLRLSSQTSEEVKLKKKTKKKLSKNAELSSPRGPRHKQMPFIAGTSTSPSHSVHANVQSILHMMKHHQPQLCERVGSLHKSSAGVKKSLQKHFAPSATALEKPEKKPQQDVQPLGSLSDLLLALQDELGQMSFEHQELVGQIDAAQHREQMQDLQGELERLVARMEEKSAQITKLRKHQQTVKKLIQSQQQCPKKHSAKKSSESKTPAPSPVKINQHGKKDGAAQNNLLLLRETQKFRNGLKQSDLSWET